MLVRGRRKRIMLWVGNSFRRSIRERNDVRPLRSRAGPFRSRPHRYRHARRHPHVRLSENHPANLSKNCRNGNHARRRGRGNHQSGNHARRRGRGNHQSGNHARRRGRGIGNHHAALRSCSRNASLRGKRSLSENDRNTLRKTFYEYAVLSENLIINSDDKRQISN